MLKLHLTANKDMKVGGETSVESGPNDSVYHTVHDYLAGKQQSSTHKTCTVSYHFMTSISACGQTVSLPLADA